MKNSFVSVARKKIAPLFVEKGFISDSNFWHRKRGSFLEIIWMQTDKYNTESHQRFTINLCVFHPTYYEKIWLDSPTLLHMATSSMISARIGEAEANNFVGGALDKWWSITSIENIPEIADEITILTENIILPFFEKFRTLEDIDSHLSNIIERKNQDNMTLIYLALVKRDLGLENEYKKLIKYVASRGGAWGKKALEIDASQT